MDKRRLGRTEHNSSIIIMGTAAFSNEDIEASNPAMEMALAAGVNHIDVAPGYGNAQRLVGEWLPPHRDKFFLGCKTQLRQVDDAWEDLQNSLKLLRTNQFDLYQLHAVGTMEELEKAFAKDGSIHTLQRAKDEGLTRFLGITGHGWDAPIVHLEALRRFDFDTVMFPIHPRLYANPVYKDATLELLEECEKRDLGVQIIKAVTKEKWIDSEQATYKTWYRPYDTQDKVQEGVNFALSQPSVAAIPSAGDLRLLPMILQAAENYQPMSESQQTALIERSSDLVSMFDGI
jgi:predicted aldo/keto reductase-like oxidoreductase